MTPRLSPACHMCDDTGYKDHAGFCMDRCDHGVEQQDRDWWADWMARSNLDAGDVADVRTGRLGDCHAVRMIARHRLACTKGELTARDIETCPTCRGEFDGAEWRASRRCPECETKKSSFSLKIDTDPVSGRIVSAMASQPLPNVALMQIAHMVVFSHRIASIGAAVLDQTCNEEFCTVPDCDCPHEHWHIEPAGTCLDVHIEEDGSAHILLDHGERELTIQGVSGLDEARNIAFGWAGVRQP